MGQEHDKHKLLLLYLTLASMGNILLRSGDSELTGCESWVRVVVCFCCEL